MHVPTTPSSSKEQVLSHHRPASKVAPTTSHPSSSKLRPVSHPKTSNTETSRRLNKKPIVAASSVDPLMHSSPSEVPVSPQTAPKQRPAPRSAAKMSFPSKPSSKTTASRSRKPLKQQRSLSEDSTDSIRKAPGTDVTLQTQKEDAESTVARKPSSLIKKPMSPSSASRARRRSPPKKPVALHPTHKQRVQPRSSSLVLHQQQAINLQTARTAITSFLKKTVALHPYGPLPAESRLPFSESTLDTVLHLARPRSDLDIDAVKKQSLNTIRQCAANILGGTQDSDIYAGTSVTAGKKSSIRRQDVANQIPFTQDVSQQLMPLTDINLEKELKLSDVVRMSSEELQSLCNRLKLIRQKAQDKTKPTEGFDGDDTLKSILNFSKPNPISCIKRDKPQFDVSLDVPEQNHQDIPPNPKHFITLVENTWIPLVIERHLNAPLGGPDDTNEHHEGPEALFPQVYLSRHLSKFQQTSHFLYSGLLHSRIPGLLRFLVRLNTLLFFETRINISIHQGAVPRSLEFAVCELPTVRPFWPLSTKKRLRSLLLSMFGIQLCDALRYNLTGIRTLWPFLFELSDCSIPQLVSAFLDTPLCRGLLSVLTLPPPVFQQTVNLITDFLRLLADMIGSVHNPRIVKKMIGRTSSRSKTIQKHGMGDTEMSKTPSVYNTIRTYIGNEQYNVVILNECLTLLADTLYYSACDRVPIDEASVTETVGRLNRQYEACKLKKTHCLVYEPIWSIVGKKCQNLSQLFQSTLTGQETNTANLFQLTTCFQFYTRSTVWPFQLLKEATINRSPPESEGFSVYQMTSPLPMRSIPAFAAYYDLVAQIPAPNNKSSHRPFSGYQVPCWRNGCPHVFSEWDIQPQHKTFFYCER